MTDLGQVSDVLVWGTLTAYTVAMLGYLTYLVNAHGPGKQDDAATARRRARGAGIGRSTVIVGLALHLAAIVTRGLAAGRAPWANLYEFTLVGSFVAVAAFVLVTLRKRVDVLGFVITFVAVLALAAALLRFHVAADGVQPALQSYWLWIHVGVAVIASGVLTLGAAGSALQLLRDSYDSGSTLLRGEGIAIRGRNRLAVRWMRWSWLEATPKAERLEVFAFRFNAIGFFLWTFTLIAGAIWAETAWGRYWNWDPKETWSFIVWIVYAAYLHARVTQRWTGRRAAWLSLLAFACVIFNFTGVNILFTGKHSYSQL